MALSLLFAPLEYALGALAFAFVAAHTQRLGDWFAWLRWAFLGLSVVVVAARLVLRQGGRRPLPNRFEYLLVVFAAVSVATLTTTVAPLLTVLKLCALALLFVVASRATALLADRYGPAAPRRLVWGLLSYMLGVLLLPGLVYLVRPGSGVLSDSGWFVGWFANPNVSGAMLALILPWLVCFLFRWSRLAGPLRAGVLLATILLAYLLLLSVSRAALLGVIAAAAAFSLVHASRRIAALVLLLAVFASARMLMNPDWLPALSKRYLYKHQRGATDVLQSRERPWRVTIARFQQRPWLGLGFGVTSETQAAWTQGVRTEGELETGSSFLGTLLQVGVLGATPLFAAILLCFASAARFAWRVKDPWFTGLYGSVLSLVFGAVFDGWLLSPGSSNNIYFWIQLFFLNAMRCRFQPARVERFRFAWQRLADPLAHRPEA